MLHGLDAAIRRGQDEARVLVLSGCGPCFCAGLDLSEQALRGLEETFHHSREWHRVFTALRRGLCGTGNPACQTGRWEANGEHS